MATTSFTDGSTVIVASWLNDVDALVYDIFNGPDLLSLHAKGDVFASNGTTVQLVNVGDNDQVLTADSSEDAGVKWASISIPTFAKGSDIDSDSPTVPTDGNYFDVTGTTTIAAFVVSADRHFFLQFDAALQLTHNSTDLDLPGEANITTAAGDVAEFFSTGSNDVHCVNYTKADGTSVVGGAGGLADAGGNIVGVENHVTTAGSFTVTNGKNLVTGGPFTIASTHVATVGTGETWTIV